MFQIRRAFTLIYVLTTVVILGTLIILIPTFIADVKNQEKVEEKLTGTQPGDLAVDEDGRVYVVHSHSWHNEDLKNLMINEKSWEIVSRGDPRFAELSYRFILHSAGLSWKEIEQKLKEESGTSGIDESNRDH